jgi:hypothetical protein
MKHSKLLLAGALAAAAWCGASQAQTVIYGVESLGSSTGTTPSESNWSAYPKHPANIGYAVTGYWDNGVWWERTDPVAVDSHGGVTYAYPETARLVPAPSAIIYNAPEVGPYGDRTYDPRTKSIRGNQ